MRRYQQVSSYEARPGEAKRVVLLYSGGLDTSCILKWIQEEHNAEVITLTLNLGQQVDDLEAIRRKALTLGATKAYVLDCRDEFADRFLSRAIKANAAYQGDYYISTISRYLMAEKAIAIAEYEQANAVAHGCTGKGNDQIRLEATALALKPEIKIIAPVREWGMGRDEELAYAKRHGIEVIQNDDFPYSSDDNMWGVTWESGEIEDPEQIPRIDRFLTVKSIHQTPTEAEYLTIGFTRGVPSELNGEEMKLATLIERLNAIGSRHGVGVCYLMEDRIVGLKVRGVYEHPGAHILISAHRKLELYVSTRLENEFKAQVDQKWSYLCYGGLLLDPLIENLDAFCDKMNEKVTGSVTVKLERGHAHVVSLSSPYALYSKNLATFLKDDSFNQNCSPGFIELYSLQMKLAHDIKRMNDLTSSRPREFSLEQVVANS